VLEIALALALTKAPASGVPCGAPKPPEVTIPCPAPPPVPPGTPVPTGGSTTPIPDPFATQGASTGPAIGPPPPCCPAPIPAVPDYQSTLVGPAALHAGRVADFYSTSGLNMTFCYAVGASRVGCATSSTGWFHLRVRRGATQYFTLRLEGNVVARLVYRDVS